ncbi:MAG: CPBP family intramembrane glutamic endopeptidase [Planctomycetota bacterium]
MKLRQLFEEADRTVLAVVLLGCVCLALSMNYASPRFGAEVLERGTDDLEPVVWHFLGSFLLLGVVPALLWKVLLGRSLREAGVTAGDARYGWRYLAWTVPLLVVPLVFLGARSEGVRSEYPLAAGAGEDAATFLFFEVVYLLFYAGYEFFFRGLLTLGLWKRIGALPAVGLSTLVSTALHYGKPEWEVWGVIVVGLVFGWLAIRTRSVLWPLVIHASIGFFTDLFVVLGPGSLR